MRYSTPSIRRVIVYESSIVGSYVDVKAPLTRARVNEDLPLPPAPKRVMEIGCGDGGGAVFGEDIDGMCVVW